MQPMHVQHEATYPALVCCLSRLWLASLDQRTQGTLHSSGCWGQPAAKAVGSCCCCAAVAGAVVYVGRLHALPAYVRSAATITSHRCSRSTGDAVVSAMTPLLAAACKTVCSECCARADGWVVCYQTRVLHIKQTRITFHQCIETERVRRQARIALPVCGCACQHLQLALLCRVLCIVDQ